MPNRINKIAVIGTGVIGTGWIIRMLAHNKKVTAFDLNIKQKAILVKEIKRSLPFVKKLFKKRLINLKNLSFKTSLIETLKDVDFIQECTTENYRLKNKIDVKILDKYFPNLSSYYMLQVHQDYCHPLFFQSVKILIEELLVIHLIQFICCLQLKLFLEKKHLKRF